MMFLSNVWVNLCCLTETSINERLNDLQMVSEIPLRWNWMNLFMNSQLFSQLLCTKFFTSLYFSGQHLTFVLQWLQCYCLLTDQWHSSLNEMNEKMWLSYTVTISPGPKHIYSHIFKQDPSMDGSDKLRFECLIFWL